MVRIISEGGLSQSGRIISKWEDSGLSQSEKIISEGRIVSEWDDYLRMGGLSQSGVLPLFCSMIENEIEL